MKNQLTQAVKTSPPQNYIEAFFREGLFGCLTHMSRELNKAQTHTYRLTPQDKGVLTLMQDVVSTRKVQFRDNPAMPGQKEFNLAADRFAVALFAAEKQLKSNNRKSRSSITVEYEESLTKSPYFKLTFTEDGEVSLLATIKNLH